MGAKDLKSQCRRKIRVFGKIDSLDASSSSSRSSSWISVVKSEEGNCAELFFKGNEEDATPSWKDSYKLDWCYEQHESVDDIFLQEVKPLVPKIFLGLDTSVIEFGTKCIEKPPLTKGFEEKPDLALLALSEILSYCEKKQSIVKISCYGIHQEHVFDLLEGEKRKQVHVFENAHGKIQLKGLNQVTLDSISDFNNVCRHRYKQCFMSKDESIDVTSSITRGMIIYVYTLNKETIEHLTGRMHFIDLLGYVEIKQKLFRGSSVTKKNKTLYALQNVICALNVNNVHVPYRESKLTHLLKDFTSKDMSHILMVVHLTPSPCQACIEAVRVASRSCVAFNNRRISACSSSYNRKPPLSSSVKRHGAIRFYSSREQSATTATRNLFCVKNHASVSIQDKPLFSDKMTVDPVLKEDDKNLSTDIVTTDHLLSKEDDKNLSTDIVTTDPLLSKEDKSLSSVRMKNHDDYLNRALDKSFSSDVGTIDPLLSKEEENSSRGDDAFETHVEEQDTPLCTSTPPLSVRLQEITNSLRRLCSEPSSFDLMEPKTPGIPFSMEVKDNLATSIFSTPREAFKTHGIEVKNTLSQGLLTYLNSANKEELMELKGIGEKRANYIIELRNKSPQPFKDIRDLRDIGVSSKQVKCMVNSIVGDLDL